MKALSLVLNELVLHSVSLANTAERFVNGGGQSSKHLLSCVIDALPSVFIGGSCKLHKRPVVYSLLCMQCDTTVYREICFNQEFVVQACPWSQRIMVLSPAAAATVGGMNACMHLRIQQHKI